MKVVGERSDLLPNDTINGLPYTPTNVQKSWQSLAGVREFIDSIANGTFEEAIKWLFRSSGLYPSGIFKPDAFLRTLLCNPSADTNTDYFDPRIGTDIKQKFKSRNLGPDGTNDEHLRARIRLTSIDRRFYITENSYFRLGPPVTSTGDVIYIFLGAKTPFLLRKQEEFFEIIAESYVQGLMSGEVMAQMQEGKLMTEMISLR